MSAVETLFQQEINQAGNLWDAIVSRVPTVFGKLMRASSCRIPGSNRYRHPVLEQAFSPEIAERVLD